MWTGGGGGGSKPNPGFVWGKRRRPELKSPALKVVKRGVESRNVEFLGSQIPADRLWVPKKGGMTATGTGIEHFGRG